MLYRKLTSSGDYSFGNNANDFYSGTTAVAQAIYTGLKLLQAEWWEDTSKGLPLFQSILGQPGTPSHIHGVDMIAQETILAVQDVQQITAFQSAYVNRRYTVTSCTVQSVYGEVVLQEVTF